MDGKFLQLWPLRSVTKAMAVLMIVSVKKDRAGTGMTRSK